MIARRLVEQVADCRCPGVSGTSVTVSVGVAGWDGRESLSAFIHRADEALYQAKLKGKNRVECAVEETLAV